MQNWFQRSVGHALRGSRIKVQSIAGKGCIKDIRECNKVVEYAQSCSDEGIFFASEGIDGDAVMCSISDSSFCTEKVVVNDDLEDGRSQQGYICCLAPAGILNMTEAVIHPISWISDIIKRVCRSISMDETSGLIRASEAGIRLRAAIVDMKVKLDWRNWEESAANEMGHCWMTDCNCLTNVWRVHGSTPSKTSVCKSI